MDASKLKPVERGNERVKSFVVGDPENPKRMLGVTVNEHIDTGLVEMSVAADEQEQFEKNHGQYVAVNLNDAG